MVAFSLKALRCELTRLLLGNRGALGDFVVPGQSTPLPQVSRSRRATERMRDSHRFDESREMTEGQLGHPPANRCRASIHVERLLTASKGMKHGCVAIDEQDCARHDEPQ